MKYSRTRYFFNIDILLEECVMCHMVQSYSSFNTINRGALHHVGTTLKRS
jgi:hypothetical protein